MNMKQSNRKWAKHTQGLVAKEQSDSSDFSAYNKWMW